MIQVYTGDGKGKTTAAIGLSVRAAGHGRRVVFIQFMKADATCLGELKVLSSIDEVRMLRFGDSMLDPVDPDLVAADILEGLREARRVLIAGEADVLVLDEANVACLMGLVSPEELLAAIEPAADGVEIVVTGRGAPAALIERADLVTEMVERKHPYEVGIEARRGIDY